MKKYVFLTLFILSVIPALSARQDNPFGEPGEETSPAQTQATMASLFGRGAKMPGIPRMGGTIALPSFDSSGMKIDETTLDAAERGERSSGNGER